MSRCIPMKVYVYSGIYICIRARQKRRALLTKYQAMLSGNGALSTEYGSVLTGESGGKRTVSTCRDMPPCCCTNTHTNTHTHSLSLTHSHNLSNTHCVFLSFSYVHTQVSVAGSVRRPNAASMLLHTHTHTHIYT